MLIAFNFLFLRAICHFTNSRPLFFAFTVPISFTLTLMSYTCWVSFSKTLLWHHGKCRCISAICKRWGCTLKDRTPNRVRIQHHHFSSISWDVKVSVKCYTSSEWWTGVVWVQFYSKRVSLYLSGHCTFHFIKAPWDAMPIAFAIRFSSIFYNSSVTINIFFCNLQCLTFVQSSFIKFTSLLA